MMTENNDLELIVHPDTELFTELGYSLYSLGLCGEQIASVSYVDISASDSNDPYMISFEGNRDYADYIVFTKEGKQVVLTADLLFAIFKQASQLDFFKRKRDYVLVNGVLTEIEDEPECKMYTQAEMREKFGITQEEIDNMPDVEIE